MEKQNITLSIRKDILRKIKILAVKHNTSVSALMSSLMEDVVTRDEGYQTASRVHLKLLHQEHNLGTQGNIAWSRDELHER